MLIGLSGWAGVGKDQVGKILVEDHGFTRLAFADALKKVAYDSHPRVRSLVSLYGWEGAKQFDDVREYLQDLGLAMRKHVNEDVWVEPVISRAMDDWDMDFVITDVRFRSEAERVVQEDGIMVRVYRPGVTPSRGHVSEVDLDNWNFDGHIYNKSTIPGLRVRVGDLLEHLRTGQKAT